MKKKLYLLCIMVLTFFISGNVMAVEHNISDVNLPKPKTPNYFTYETNREHSEAHDSMKMIMTVDENIAKLAEEYYDDSDAFYEKYGLYYFNIVMQYDVSLDNEENWQYTSEWDKKYNIGGYGDGYQSVSLVGSLAEDFEFFWLTYHEGQGSNTFVPYQPAIIEKEWKNGDYTYKTYYFDVENHSLYIRCRYYIEWETFNKEKNEIGERQSKYSEWSDSAIFGKNTTQIIPIKPTKYDAPIISDLKIIPPAQDEQNSTLTYIQKTPESVWLANIYYLMTDDGEFTGLKTEISIDGGEWIEVSTADSGGDWSIANGSRLATLENIKLTDESNVKVRIRFTGSSGESEWSNVLEINGGGHQDIVDNDDNVEDDKSSDEKDKCWLCSFCFCPLGICLFIWLLVLLIIIVIFVIVIKKKKKKNGGKDEK